MTTSDFASLLADRPSQTYVTVSAINTGTLMLRHDELFADAQPGLDGTYAESFVPCFSFLVEHPTQGKLLFDLGLRKGNTGYPAQVQRNADESKTECIGDVAEQLSKGMRSVEPGEVQRIVYSHLHWDHVGDVRPFSNAKIIIGIDSKDVVANASSEGKLHPFPQDRELIYVNFRPASQTTPPTTTENSSVLDKPVFPLGAFERAIDFYEDGSFYLIDAPGHMAGHLAALARVGPGGTFVLLAGDTCHDRQCYLRSDNADQSTTRKLSKIIYADVDVAQDTVRRLTRMSEESGVAVILTHEKEHLAEEPLMPLFPDILNDWTMQKVMGRESTKIDD